MFDDAENMASSITPTRWEELRKKARQLENEIDLKLVSFSKLGTNYSQRDGYKESSDTSPLLNSSSSERLFETMGLEIEQLLSKLTEVNDSMAEYTAGFNLGQPNATQLHTLQRHRDILQGYSHEFSKTKANIQAFRDREDLLGSVHRDINAYKTGMNRRTDLYLKENEHIRNSDRLADDVIGVALATKENLQSQRGVLHGVTSRLSAVTTRFPALNSLIQRINVRKRRDSIILASVISICIILMLIYALG
ncbi:Golgi SNAP receptor complex member 1-like [Pocillopora damicornis]|uniref:Golgi SNAP receptor complex member 1-like n=1 Tax=Pocillopora damicornis TaxID=46731 RepID=UPI000F552217|nr:Golgi SNAP receptor complex member 1-like [Pocillopora damicornis]XP_058964570.1 Golgi SNAP receptor complex member 1-like [Pocillopora verrucosa]